MHTVFIYTEGVRSERGGRSLPAQRSLAETGGAVSALTPEVSTLCYVNPVLATGGGKVRQHRAPLTKRRRV